MDFQEWLSSLFHNYSTPEQKLSDKEVTNLILKSVKDAPLIKNNYDLSKISIPATVYRDALTGAQRAAYGNYGPEAFIVKAFADRLDNMNEKKRGFKSPTGADYFDIWNPDLVVPKKEDMSNIWE